MAQSLGQQVKTRSHDSSARLEIKCIMYTGSLTRTNSQALWGRRLRRVTSIHIINKRLQTPARRSVDASTLSRKFANLNNYIFEKKSSACTSDAVLRKYYDTLPRSKRFRQLFNDENRNRSYVELGKTDHCYGGASLQHANTQTGKYQANISGDRS